MLITIINTFLNLMLRRICISAFLSDGKTSHIVLLHHAIDRKTSAFDWGNRLKSWKDFWFLSSERCARFFSHRECRWTRNLDENFVFFSFLIAFFARMFCCTFAFFFFVLFDPFSVWVEESWMRTANILDSDIRSALSQLSFNEFSVSGSDLPQLRRQVVVKGRILPKRELEIDFSLRWTFFFRRFPRDYCIRSHETWMPERLFTYHSSKFDWQHITQCPWFDKKTDKKNRTFKFTPSHNCPFNWFVLSKAPQLSLSAHRLHCSPLTTSVTWFCCAFHWWFYRTFALLCFCSLPRKALSFRTEQIVREWAKWERGKVAGKLEAFCPLKLIFPLFLNFSYQKPT